MTPDYLERTIEEELDETLSELPAVLLEGPKAVGKTATAVRRASSRFSLDLERDREIARAAPERILDAPRPVLVDEWQHHPDIWSLIRHRVDDGAEPGSYILAGSAQSIGKATHSGAGRIVSIRMRPMSLFERGGAAGTVSTGELLRSSGGACSVELSGTTDWRLERYVAAIAESGFPGIRAYGRRNRDRQLDGYLRRVVDRDIEVETGRRLRSAPTLERWMAAYAAATATTASFEKISAAAEPEVGDRPSQSLVRSYREALEALWVLDPISSWHPVRGGLSRLKKAPKHHLVDPALAVRLLGLDEASLLQGSPGSVSMPREGSILGALFESLVAQSVRVYAEAAGARVSHLQVRRPEQREIDLVVERRDGRFVAIEVKLTATPEDRDVRNLRWAIERFGEDVLDAIVVTTGDIAYRRSDGVGVVPAALLAP